MATKYIHQVIQRDYGHHTSWCFSSSAKALNFAKSVLTTDNPKYVEIGVVLEKYEELKDSQILIKNLTLQNFIDRIVYSSDEEEQHYIEINKKELY